MKIKKMNKKGHPMDLLVWMVLCFIVIIFLGIFLYAFNTVYNVFHGMDFQVTDNTQFDTIVNDTIGVVQPTQEQGVHQIVFVMMIVYAIGIFITAYFARSSPIFFVLYLIVLVSSVMVSVFISNTYESIAFDTTNDAAGTLQGFTGGTFVLMHLPEFTVVIGFVSLIILFMGIIYDQRGGAI